MPNEASRPLPLQYPAIPAYCFYHRVSFAHPCAEFRTWGADLDFTQVRVVSLSFLFYLILSYSIHSILFYFYIFIFLELILLLSKSRLVV